jgi:hypothetical protein
MHNHGEEKRFFPVHGMSDYFLCVDSDSLQMQQVLQNLNCFIHST